MAALPWIAMGLSALNMFRPKPKTGVIDPRPYIGQMKEGALSDIRSNINMLNLQNQLAIKQAGAAKRMPSGAIASNLAGSTYQSGRTLAEAIPRINSNFANLELNALNKYNLAQAQAENAYHNNIWQTFGSLGKIALLWQSGLLKPQEK